MLLENTKHLTLISISSSHRIASIYESFTVLQNCWVGALRVSCHLTSKSASPKPTHKLDATPLYKCENWISKMLNSLAKFMILVSVKVRPQTYVSRHQILCSKPWHFGFYSKWTKLGLNTTQLPATWNCRLCYSQVSGYKWMTLRPRPSGEAYKIQQYRAHVACAHGPPVGLESDSFLESCKLVLRSFPVHFTQLWQLPGTCRHLSSQSLI